MRLCDRVTPPVRSRVNCARLSPATPGPDYWPAEWRNQQVRRSGEETHPATIQSPLGTDWNWSVWKGRRVHSKTLGLQGTFESTSQFMVNLQNWLSQHRSVKEKWAKTAPQRHERVTRFFKLDKLLFFLITFVYKSLSCHESLESTAFPKPLTQAYSWRRIIVSLSQVSLSWELYGCSLGIPIPNEHPHSGIPFREAQGAAGYVESVLHQIYWKV